MKIKTKTSGDVGILEVHGKLMGGNEAEEIRDEIRTFFGENVKNIVISLKHVSWMNSLGMGAIMGAYTTVMNHNGKVCLTGLNEKVRSLLILTQLSKIFATYPTEDEAVNSFSN